MSFKNLQPQIQAYLKNIKTIPDTNEYDCKLCKDTELIIHNKQEVSEWQEWCDCHWNKEVYRELSKSGINQKQMDMKIADFRTDDSDHEVMKLRNEMKRMATEYVKAPQGLFLASGLTGGGKTLISTIVAKNVASKLKGFVYMKWSDDLSQASKNFNELNPMYWDKLKKVDVLYIDDFLKNQRAKRYGENDEDYHVLRDVPKFEYDYAFNLIKYRADNEKITIISTEYSLTEIGRMNPALEGRLTEMIRKGGKSFYIPNDNKYNYRINGKF